MAEPKVEDAIVEYEKTYPAMTEEEKDLFKDGWNRKKRNIELNELRAHKRLLRNAGGKAYEDAIKPVEPEI